MAVVEYRCDKCNRTTEIIRNIRGLETLKKCIITHGCTGNLHQTELLENHIRGKDSSPVIGVDDFIPRVVLYDYKQPFPRKTWKIVHNLNTIPIVLAYDTSMKLLPLNYTVIVQDENTILLEFPTNTAGIAQLVSNNTSDNLKISLTELPVEDESLGVVSNNGSLVIATLLNNSNVWVTLEFTDQQGITTEHTYNLDLTCNDSAWGDTTSCIIKGKQLVLRSFSFMFDQTINSNFVRFKSISNGNSLEDVYFDSIDRPLSNTNAPSNNIFIMLSGKQKTVYDKIFNRIIDVSAVNKTTNVFSFVVSNGDFLASENIIQDVYPLIRTI